MIVFHRISGEASSIAGRMKILDISSSDTVYIPVSDYKFSSKLETIFLNHFDLINRSNQDVLMIDGDVFPALKSLKELRLPNDKNVVVYQPLVYNAFFKTFRHAGVHLYRRSFFKSISGMMRDSTFDYGAFHKSLRPETYIKYGALKIGQRFYFSRKFFGFEDFTLYPSDIIRKGALFERKYPEYLRRALSNNAIDSKIIDLIRIGMSLARENSNLDVLNLEEFHPELLKYLDSQKINLEMRGIRPLSLDNSFSNIQYLLRPTAYSLKKEDQIPFRFRSIQKVRLLILSFVNFVISLRR